MDVILLFLFIVDFQAAVDASLILSVNHNCWKETEACL
jgi:hypothetical protein